MTGSNEKKAVLVTGPLCPSCKHHESSRNILSESGQKLDISNVARCTKCGRKWLVFPNEEPKEKI